MRRLLAGACAFLLASQLLGGTASALISLTAQTPATFGTTLAPGATVTSTGGTLTAVSTSLSWSLTVKDAAAGNPGHLIAGNTGCTGSTSALSNAVKVTVTPVIAVGAIIGAGQKSISATDTVVSSSTNALLSTAVFNTVYQQTIGGAEILTAGCVYSMTATYTLQ